MNTSLAEVKRCFTNHVRLYRSLLCGWRSTRWRKGAVKKNAPTATKKFFCGCWCNFFSPPPCGDVAGQHGEVKSERSVTAFKSPAGVSVLNPEGGTSSSGSVWAQVRSYFAHHGVCLSCYSVWSGGPVAKLIHLHELFCRRNQTSLPPLQKRFDFHTLVLFYKKLNGLPAPATTLICVIQTKPALKKGIAKVDHGQRRCDVGRSAPPLVRSIHQSDQVRSSSQDRSGFLC